MQVLYVVSPLLLYDHTLIKALSLLIGSAVLSLFYESMLKLCGSVAVHMAFGEVSRGKSNAVKIALAACCNFPKGYETFLTDSSARRHLSGALPFAYDDPSNEAVLKQLLINAFGGAEMSNDRNQFRARCVPLVTANDYVVDNIAAAEQRYIG